MAIWAEIKRALNSTLGTASFKSLDTLITGAITTAQNSITTAITNAQNNVNTNSNNIKTLTATNNTANATGILSQKLSYIITQRQASLTGSGTVVYSGNITTAATGYKCVCIAKFIAPVDGIYNVALTANAQTHSSPIRVYKVVDAFHSYMDGSTLKTIEISQSGAYQNSSVNTESHCGSFNGANSVTWDNSNKIKMVTTMPCLGVLVTNNKNVSAKTLSMYCHAGEPVQLIECALDAGVNPSLYIHSISVTYQGR